MLVLTAAILTNNFPLGYWRNLWSSLDFADQPLESCLNIIHTDIVETWSLYEKNSVSSVQLPCCFNCSMELVSVKRPIQDKDIPHCQRSSSAGWQHVAKVSMLHYK